MGAPRPELMRLLSACKAEPEDDAARLVLADWLEEYGDEDDRERAAFVRLQVTGGPGNGQPDLRALRWDRWQRSILQWAPFQADLAKGRHLADERGLVVVDAKAKAVNGPQGLRWAGTVAWAWVERLRVRPPTAQLDHLLASPLLDTLGVLHLHQSRINDEDMAALADAFRPSWRGLWLQEMGFGPGGLAALIASPNAAGLRSLRLGESTLPRAAAIEAAFPALRELDLPGSAGAEWARALRSAPWRLDWLYVSRYRHHDISHAVCEVDSCAGLRRLAISGLTGPDIGHLLAARFLPSLERLTLFDCFINPEDIGRFSRAAVPGLRWLSLFATRLLPDPLRTLASSGWMASLTHLEVRDPHFGPLGVEALTAMPAAPLALDLRDARMGDDGLRTLAAWPGMARCRMLYLGMNGITDAGVEAFTDSPYIDSLIGLDLSGNQIGDAGAARVLGADWAGRLVQLNLSGNPLTEGVIPALLAARLGAMRELRLTPAAVSAAVRERLAYIEYVDGGES